jgi:regulator of replication initiation timing
VKQTADEMEQMIVTNTQLQMENGNLKRQLSQALEVTTELELLHTKN